MTRTIAIALGLLLATSGFAAETSAPAPAAPAAAADDPAACVDDSAAQAKKAKEKEAKLAELGRRLDAEPKIDGEFRVLYRSGHNYDVRSTAPSPIPPAKSAPPSAKPERAAESDTKSR